MHFTRFSTRLQNGGKSKLFTRTIWLSIAIVAFIGGVPLWLALLTVRLQRLAEASAQFKSAEPSIRGLSQQILEDSSFRMYLDARIKHLTASPFSGESRFVKLEPKRGAGWSVQESLAEAIDQSELLEAVRSQVRRLTESGHARRNARASKSHRKRRRRQLAQLGIDPDMIKSLTHPKSQ